MSVDATQTPACRSMARRWWEARPDRGIADGWGTQQLDRNYLRRRLALARPGGSKSVKPPKPGRPPKPPRRPLGTPPA